MKEWFRILLCKLFHRRHWIKDEWNTILCRRCGRLDNDDRDPWSFHRVMMDAEERKQ